MVRQPELCYGDHTDYPMVPGQDKTNLPSMYSTSAPHPTRHELSSETAIHELPPGQVPLRELASRPVPTPIYELPSPVFSTHGSLRSKPSFTHRNPERNNGGNVSPLAGPYASNSPAAVSEISLLEVEPRKMT